VRCWPPFELSVSSFPTLSLRAIFSREDTLRGIAIATFQLGGTLDELKICGNVEYTNRTDHTAHAAIYYDQDASGMCVIDQCRGPQRVRFCALGWNGRAAGGAMSYYQFVCSDDVPIHDGKKYYVIDGPPYLSQKLLRYSTEAA
jgi:hypothetical protein